MKPAPTHSYPGLNLGRRHASAHKATEVVTFGFWVFLMSDLVYFGLMFGVYITMIDAQAGGPGPHELFDLETDPQELTDLGRSEAHVEVRTQLHERLMLRLTHGQATLGGEAQRKAPA